MQRRGNGVLDLDHVGVAELVEFARGHSRGDMRRDVVEHLGGERAGHAHLGDLFGGFERNGHGRQLRNSSLMLVLARVRASTCLTITAQYRWQLPSPEGRLPATTTEPAGTRP